MSTPRLIYPLLDGFLLGDAISQHSGVRCYPAIQQKTGEKYIVKVISVPASQVQLDALLLTGAFSGRDGALDYFKRLAKDLAKEAQVLQNLSRQEGFIAYQNSQVISAADSNGYEVYLLGEYKHSLERVFAANEMTHRGVLELGLDLCAALAACRRSGYLYVDLKPGNVFCSPEHGSRIGDIGFVSLSSLQFTPLHKQYFSRYTAPEMADDFAVINSTLDVYALGVILYQACNGGVLPEADDFQVPPMYADYALSEIILKACAQNPADRWQDPTQMAQALIGYMQQNEVTDAPLIPAPIVDEPVETEEFLPDATAEEIAQEIAALPQDVLQELAGEELSPSLADVTAEEDISQILAQADDLIAHELPDPAVAPEPVVLPMPEPILPEAEPEPEPEQADMPETESEPQPEPEPEPETPPVSEKESVIAAKAEPQEANVPRPRRAFPWHALLIVILAALVILCGILAKQYYDDVYVQSIDQLVITHSEDSATVKIETSMNETLLTVICSDSYGNTQRASVSAGVAVFTGLQPQTRYTIRVESTGNHKLTGQTSGTFTTPQQTQILTFTACMGPDDVSVLLTLTSSGPTVETWTVTYQAEGIPASSVDFTGNTVTIGSLVAGKEYTFTLSAKGQTLGGATETVFAASNVIIAQDLTITACGGGSLTAQWSAPENVTVTDGWAVHCYDGSGFDETVVTYEPWYTFIGMDHTTECYVEVTAVGMYQSASTSVSANPVTIESYSFSVSAENGLTSQWKCNSETPSGGWILEYSMDGAYSTLTTDECRASVYALPGGSYTFSVQVADGRHVFGGSSSYTLTEVGTFTGYGITGDGLSVTLSLPQLTLTADEETQIEASEDSIEILYILRSGNGILMDISTADAVWDTLWQDNICTLTLPNVPQLPGQYRISVYFAGGLVTEQAFTIE